MPTPLPISGYVLAGGRSSRMGADKSLLHLAGKPLIAHAVARLSRVCEEVHILSSNPALASYAPLVPDLHPDCGPLSGIEAALTHNRREWALIAPVDVPFLPAAVLRAWAADVVSPGSETRVALFEAEGRPQPAICLLHREIAPSIAAAISLGEYKLMPVLRSCAEVIPLRLEHPFDQHLDLRPVALPPEALARLTPAQIAAQSRWFANLNTPEDLADAERNAQALDS